jgi:hypothetical protein
MENELENVEETQQAEETKFMSEGDDSVTKVNLDKPTEDEKPEETTEAEGSSADDTGVAGSDEGSDTTEEQEEVQPQAETQEQGSVLEEITDEVEEEVAVIEEEVVEAVKEAEATGEPLPENIQKLVDFMNETGGSIEDYVSLNKDYTNADDMAVIQEYYKQTKPHLNAEERKFLIEENFSFDEDVDEERDIRKKKIAFKEQVAEAKAYLDGQKSKYYEEIKAGSKLTKEQQKAIDFFNRYNKESEENQRAVKTNSDIFEKKTNSFFNDKFKGFEYKVGDKKYRFNVKDIEGVKQKQSDLNSFTSKFVDENQALVDAAGYHKSLFTAMNADAIAQHFYEQGKADALKESVKNSKNINMDPRQTQGSFEAGGIKVKVLGDTSSDYKFKIRNKK